ncbi:MAG: 4Fe-4S double cluster binding domain-containing protein [Candidatus Thorarchaeota archaeon]
MKERYYATQIQSKCLEWGATHIGFAELADCLPKEFADLPRGISIVYHLSERIIDELKTGPTRAYAYHYYAVNRLLDDVALHTTKLLQQWGYQGFPIPTSQTVNLKTHEGHLSHKMVATRAGLGWIGKNALLITPEYGPRVRLTTILTDAPLRTGKPINESQCGECLRCSEACPGGAILGNMWKLASQRADLLEVEKCADIIERNKAEMGAPICGICVRVCPKGMKGDSEKA